MTVPADPVKPTSTRQVGARESSAQALKAWAQIAADPVPSDPKAAGATAEPVTDRYENPLLVSSGKEPLNQDRPKGITLAKTRVSEKP